MGTSIYCGTDRESRRERAASRLRRQRSQGRKARRATHTVHTVMGLGPTASHSVWQGREGLQSDGSHWGLGWSGRKALFLLLCCGLGRIRTIRHGFCHSHHRHGPCRQSFLSRTMNRKYIAIVVAVSSSLTVPEHDHLSCSCEMLPLHRIALPCSLTPQWCVNPSRNNNRLLLFTCIKKPASSLSQPASHVGISRICRLQLISPELSRHPTLGGEVVHSSHTSSYC